MDDNENILDYQKMNFSPFTTQFAGIPANAVNQFTTSKFAQNITTANGQVVGVVSGGEGGVHYIRPVDGTGAFTGQMQAHNATNLNEPQTLITLPITMPGAKPGDAQQTVHIQVLNPNPLPQQAQKFQVGQMQIPIQGFQPGGTTVLTVAYNPQDGKLIPNHGFPEGMTVVAAIQPQDLHLLAQAQAQAQVQAQAQNVVNSQVVQQHSSEQEQNCEDDQNKSQSVVQNIKQEPEWDSIAQQNSQPDLSEYINQTTQGLNLQQFLKFNTNPTVKYEFNNGIQITATIPTEPEEATEGAKPKRKRKPKKKPPKPKPPKPGQVLIATAIDGTVLFCCPECQMAYPEKENLEQHLSVHKIERRYICELCGAGLKRKEHLERHKSGHSPERPYICSVCLKGFKRKEHLNLHFVIHSGEKNEICLECGKGFYRKDHLRKHAKSHAAKRLKEEMNARAGIGPIKIEKVEPDEDGQTAPVSVSTSTQMSDGQSQDCFTPNVECVLSASDSHALQTNNTQAPISLSTVYVPTSDNTTLPVQIQIPHIVTTSSGDITTNCTEMASNCTDIASYANNPTNGADITTGCANITTSGANIVTSCAAITTASSGLSMQSTTTTETQSQHTMMVSQ